MRETTRRVRPQRRLAKDLFVAGFGLVSALAAMAPAEARAQTCNSTDPNDWPASSKPYFMLAVDTSGSMVGCTNPSQPSPCGGFSNPACDSYQYPNSCPDLGAAGFTVGDGQANSCGLEPTRLNDAKCAMRKTIQAFSGEVNFGLMTYARNIGSCPAGACADSCTNTSGSCNQGGEDYGCTISNFTNGDTCGNTPDCSGTNHEIYTGATVNGVTLPGDNWRNGGNVVVDLLQDPTWGPNPPTSNVPSLLEWFDGQCGNNREIFAAGSTPLEGILRTGHQYYANGWASGWANNNYCPTGGPAIDHPSPIDAAQDRTCRSLNVILVTDGDETCNGTPANAAEALYKVGVTIQGVRVPVRTYVIGFAGASAGQLNPIADRGDDGNANTSTTALFANNEVELAQALSAIISGAVRPEICNNGDDNCNGCIDEGYTHYCNLNPTCCSWANTTARDACLANYEASIDSSNPLGDQTLLPCTTVAQQADVTTGLCYDPGDVCDDIDDNCDGATDEGALKCGDPLACPTAETCDSLDNDCDGLVDNSSGSGVPYSVCPGGCVPSPEVCDGCDNDCDGDIDEGLNNPVTCGFPTPPNCLGTQTCQETLGAGGPGVCRVPPGGQFTACNNTPGTETCDGFDNDCNGIVDDSPTGTGNACTPTGTEPTIGECSAGAQQCQNGSFICVGYQGPSPEICDGLDNDCDGFVDGTRPGGSLVACNPAASDPCAGQGANTACAEDLAEGLGNFYCVLPTQGAGLVCQGACAPGKTECVGGTLVCDGGGVTPQPEICDGLDNNCDGSTDEGTLGDGPTNPGCWTTAGTACSFTGNSNTVTWSPPPGATCDGLGTLVSPPCEAGTLLCQSGAWVCVGATPPQPEVCDGADNDCNGFPDDNVTEQCGQTDVGACEFGTRTCTNGVWGACVGEIPPTTELCDGLDNDCDTLTDDNVPGVGVQCGSDIGECQHGIKVCSGGQMICSGEVPPTSETCNGLDDNCDGVTDNALSDAPTAAEKGCWTGWTGSGTSCSWNGVNWTAPPNANCHDVGSLTSPCFTGQLSCQSGAWACVGGQVPAAGGETCDGIDNDCNGFVDDSVPGTGGTCTPNPTDPTVGECQAGTTQCLNANMVCVGYVGPQPELCDDLDNNCDGVTDENAPGTGNPCGLSLGACSQGTTQCVGGVLLCQGGTDAQPEVCNGVDDDCNGVPDDGALDDAPTDYDCWDIPGTQCSFANVTWDPPPNGNCQDLGGLSSACSLGKLTCDGANLWKCVGGQPPVAEVCDGLDNDCNSVPDDGDPQGGGSCGTDVGICQTGIQKCSGGVLVCDGGVQPTTETCNGLDDDCDGTVDNGIALGGACAAPYNATQYPGPRDSGECRPGALACDTAGGSGGTICVGGVGPQPEVCDGKDNDCDGQIDETSGAGPDSVNGSVDPADPSRHLGDPCGSDVGVCTLGHLSCEDGAITCTGGIPPQPYETCNCEDDDCDGQVDEVDPADTLPICGGGGSCVSRNGACECATPCGRGEFACPTGTTCESLTTSTGQTGQFCVGESPCNDCPSQTVTDATGAIVCSPTGVGSAGESVPACACKGPDGCQNPCFGLACPADQKCVPTGAFQTSCQASDNCNFFGCADGEACNGGGCVANPCVDAGCAADQACKPSADFKAASCEASCAGVSCGAGQICQGGACQDTGCGAGCADGEVCAGDVVPGAGCVADPCTPNPCLDGSFCSPLSGACVADPCAGVICPTGQVCILGECNEPVGGGTMGNGGSGGSGGAAGASGASSGGQSTHGSDAGNGGGAGGATSGASGSGNGAQGPQREVFGLATGGGGCACRLSPPKERPRPVGLLAAALVVGLAVSRRRESRGGAR